MTLRLFKVRTYLVEDGSNSPSQPVEETFEERQMTVFSSTSFSLNFDKAEKQSTSKTRTNVCSALVKQKKLQQALFCALFHHWVLVMMLEQLRCCRPRCRVFP
jgi:hypothetical protein